MGVVHVAIRLLLRGSNQLDEEVVDGAGGRAMSVRERPLHGDGPSSRCFVCPTGASRHSSRRPQLRGVDRSEKSQHVAAEGQLGKIRAQNEELTRMGLTLPGFVERSKVIASLPSLGSICSPVGCI